MEKKYICRCCGLRTLEQDNTKNGKYEVCPVCAWEDDWDSKMTPKDFSASNGLTLAEGKKNFKDFGACEREQLENVRKPKKEELTK